MEKYRKKIKTGIAVGGVFLAVSVGLFVFNLLVVFELISYKPENDVLLSFQSGLLSGIGLVVLINIIRFAKALKSQERLQKLYNAEHDERKLMIAQKAGMPMIAITSSVLILAAIVAGYYSNIVFITLTAAVLVQLFISLAVKIYYMRTM